MKKHSNFILITESNNQSCDTSFPNELKLKKGENQLAETPERFFFQCLYKTDTF